MDFDFSDIWDRIVDEFEYIYTFEFLGDVGEYFSGFFENITELSVGGIIFGIIGVILTHITVGKLNFIANQGAVGGLFWRIVMYIFSFVLTYLMTSRALNMD